MERYILGLRAPRIGDRSAGWRVLEDLLRMISIAVAGRASSEGSATRHVWKKSSSLNCSTASMAPHDLLYILAFFGEGVLALCWPSNDRA